MIANIFSVFEVGTVVLVMTFAFLHLVMTLFRVLFPSKSHRR